MEHAKCNITYPRSALEDEACKIHGCGRDVTLGVAHETVIEETDLHQVFAQSTGLDIVVIGLGDTSKEVHGVGEAHVVLEGCEDVTFSIENLLIREGLIGNMAKVGDVRGEHLLILGGNEHGGNTNELKTIKGDNFSR